MDSDTIDNPRGPNVWLTTNLPSIVISLLPNAESTREVYSEATRDGKCWILRRLLGVHSYRTCCTPFWHVNDVIEERVPNWWLQSQLSLTSWSACIKVGRNYNYNFLKFNKSLIGKQSELDLLLCMFQNSSLSTKTQTLMWSHLAIKSVEIFHRFFMNLWQTHICRL